MIKNENIPYAIIRNKNDNCVEIDRSKMVEVPNKSIFDEDETRPFIEYRQFGDFANKAFYINEHIYDWALCRDKDGALMLIPLKKG